MSTFVFSLTWQFNQFTMLVQALGLFALDSLDMLPAAKVSARQGRGGGGRAVPVADAHVCNVEEIMLFELVVNLMIILTLILLIVH